EERQQAAGSGQQGDGRRETSPPPSKMGEVGRGLLLQFLSRRAVRAQDAERRRQERRALAKTLPCPLPQAGGGLPSSPPPSKMGEVGRGLLLLFLSRRAVRATRTQGASRRRQERRALAKTLPCPSHGWEGFRGQDPPPSPSRKRE